MITVLSFSSPDTDTCLWHHFVNEKILNSMLIVLLLSKARKTVSELGTPLCCKDDKLMKSMYQVLYNALLETVGSMFCNVF